MDLKIIKHNFQLGTMKLNDIEALIKKVEQQQKNNLVLSQMLNTEQVKNSILQDKLVRIEKEFASMDESVTECDMIIAQLQGENLRIAQELALLKGEMSG